jgi:glycosyltransferase involved in cell wall biosynthesis
MKIAFVNQPIDTILPPFQTSVGACTYGLASSLANFCDVTVYGLKDRNEGAGRDARCPNVRFRFLPSAKSDRLMSRAREAYSKLHQLKTPASSSRWSYPAFGRHVATDLQRQPFDVIHVQHCSQYVPIIRALNPNSKIVLHLHAEWFPQNGDAVLERRLRDVDLVTTVSDYVSGKTRQQFPSIASRCETIYNGVEASEFSRERNYDNRRKEKQIIYSGAVSPHKGIHVLLNAFKYVVKRYPHVRLDIIGFQGSYGIEETFDMTDKALVGSVARFYAKNRVSRVKAKLLLGPPDAGTYLSYLKSQLSPDIAERVSFLGFIPRPQLIEHYYNADICAFPPIWDEGFGIPPVEAMAAGVPVVGSRSGALVETIKDQQTGILVEKNDAAALGDALLRLLENDTLREMMGKAARRRVLTRFTWEQAAQSAYIRYRALCEEGALAGGRCLSKC